MHESAFRSFDGTSLVYRAWLPAGGPGRAIVLFHRGHEHGARWADVVALMQTMQPADTAYFAWDARGHGKSPGQHGHARHFSDLVRDVEAFIRHIEAEHGIAPEDMAVIAHSVGAVVVGRWALDYAPRLRALVLATPALQVKLYVPFAQQFLRLGQWLDDRRGRPQRFLRSYVTGSALTHDIAEIERYDSDPLIQKPIAVNILLGLFESAERLVRRAGDLEIPTMVLSSRADWVVKNLPMRRLYRRLGHARKSIRVYKDAYHAIFHETIREQVVRDVSGFIDECFAHPVDRSALRTADRHGASFERFEWHKAGLPWLSPKRWGYRLTRLAMETLGRLSYGVRLGLQSGFSSGRTLAYVYENRPRGVSLLGRAIDRNYLDSPGWAAIRVRRQNLQTLLRDALQRRGERPEVRVFDLAGGPGHYLIDMAQEIPALRVRVRDFDERGLNEGRARAAALGLDRVTFEQGDAFDASALETLGGGWDVGIISGLLELFPSNAPVEVALRGAAAAIATGGFLIYTNQPWHPQIELIAETLTHGDGRPWIMRCRSQAEMDELVAQAGFRKLAQLCDDDAIFTVSLARRE